MASTRMLSPPVPARGGAVLWPTAGRSSPGYPSCPYSGAMPAEMILHEGRDEEVGVVVAVLVPQRERDAGSRACRLQKLGLQLAGEEGVGRALVDEDVGQAGAIGDQGACVVGPPRIAIGSKVARERLLAPGAAHRRGNRREGRDGGEPA